MKPNQKELTEKKFIQLQKELNSVSKRIREAPWRKLEEPYQEGWFVSLVLKETIRDKKEGPDMEKVIKLCSPDRWYVLRDPTKVTKLRKAPGFEESKELFIYENWEGKRSYHGPYLMSLTNKKWENFTLEELPMRIRNRWFERVVKTYNVGPNPRKEISYKPVIPHNYLEYKVKKRIVTHVQDINPDLISREAELEQMLKPYWRTSDRYSGYSWEHYEERRGIRRHSKDAIQKLKSGEIEDVKDYRKLNKRTS